MINKAAQFSPFAALTGYDAAILETGRITDEKIKLDDDAFYALNLKLQILVDRLNEKPEVTFIYFKSDERKIGGEYSVWNYQHIYYFSASYQ